MTWKMIVVLAVLVAAGAGLRASTRAALADAEPQDPPVTIRFVWLTATPKPGTKVDPQALPPVFQKLQNGWDVPIPAEPEGFLTKLREAEPRFTYKLLLAGTSAPITNHLHLISAGPRTDDPLRHAVHEVIRVQRWDSPNTLRTHRVGQLFWKHEHGSAGAGWDDTATPDGNEQVLGTTKSMGIQTSPSGELTFYASSFVRDKVK